VLSGGRITPGIIEYLLWELPLKIGNQLLHSALLSLPMQQGLRTVSLEDISVQSDVDRLTAIVMARMKQQKEKSDETP
jgi:5,10-methylene-tetrahydrofolate dehydrogenase/methenyl tetrahydrofolate cyclohydrolase